MLSKSIVARKNNWNNHRLLKLRRNDPHPIQVPDGSAEATRCIQRSSRSLQQDQKLVERRQQVKTRRLCQHHEDSALKESIARSLRQVHRVRFQQPTRSHHRQQRAAHRVLTADRDSLSEANHSPENRNQGQILPTDGRTQPNQRRSSYLLRVLCSEGEAEQVPAEVHQHPQKLRRNVR